MAKKDNELAFSAEGGNAEKLKALQAAMDKIEKSFGKGSIMKLGDERIQDVEVIPTGSIGLNYALGVGGYPKGRIIEIYGPESSGKTTVALHAIAEAQKKGGEVAFIDVEHALDPAYAQKIGVDVDKLVVSQIQAHVGDAGTNGLEENQISGLLLGVIDDADSRIDARSRTGELHPNGIVCHREDEAGAVHTTPASPSIYVGYTHKLLAVVNHLLSGFSRLTNRHRLHRLTEHGHTDGPAQNQAADNLGQILMHSCNYNP